MTLEMALFDIDEDGEVIEATATDDSALSKLAVLVVLRDVMHNSLGVVLDIDRRVSSNWGMSGGWSYRELAGRLEVKRHGEEKVSGSMTWVEIDDLLGEDLKGVRAWAAGLDETRQTQYWTRSRPVELEKVYLPWSADEWWKDVEGEHYTERLTMWEAFIAVLTKQIDRIESESGVQAPGFKAWATLRCEACGEVCSDFTLNLNHGRAPRPLCGRDELVCSKLEVLINRASFDVSGRKHKTSRMVDGRIVTEETKMPPSWDEAAELIDYGWTFAPDGTPIAPEGWPRAEEVRA